MERFLQFILAGGLTLVVGLWTLQFGERFEPGWLLGVGITFVSIALLTIGIWIVLEFR